MADESGVGEVSDIFTDVQPRNRTETDTEVSSDLLESLIEAVWRRSASRQNVFIQFVEL